MTLPHFSHSEESFSVAKEQAAYWRENYVKIGDAMASIGYPHAGTVGRNELLATIEDEWVRMKN